MQGKTNPGATPLLGSKAARPQPELGEDGCAPLRESVGSLGFLKPRLVDGVHPDTGSHIFPVVHHAAD